MKKQLTIQTCPNCGSDQITRVCRDWQGKYRNQVYVVPDLAFYECPVCRERVFTPETVAKIREYSPAYRKPVKVTEKALPLPAVPV